MMMNSLNSIPISVSQYLAGSKRGVIMGGRAYVSPAMWDLLSHADEAELQRLLKAIKFIHLGPDILPSLPMTTCARA